MFGSTSGVIFMFYFAMPSQQHFAPYLRLIAHYSKTVPNQLLRTRPDGFCRICCDEIIEGFSTFENGTNLGASSFVLSILESRVNLSSASVDL